MSEILKSKQAVLRDRLLGYSRGEIEMTLREREIEDALNIPGVARKLYEALYVASYALAHCSNFGDEYTQGQISDAQDACRRALAPFPKDR